MYGVTECKRCTYLPPHLIDTKPGSVGIAIPNTEIVVVDEDDKPCAPHQVGQLVVRGGTVMQGYWKLPAETAKKIREHPVRGGRCLYTGDYGYLDEDGCFYFKGRIDEVIKVRGRKLIPRDVEDVLRGVAGVREATVICTALADGDYHIAAFVEADAGAVDTATLRGRCRASLENYQIPGQFVVLGKLPRNSNGKIDRLELGRHFPAPRSQPEPTIAAG
ncbi:MAG: class I adenylate-forming enzyme family protein, partial [Streptosporangiaceae bacterium]